MMGEKGPHVVVEGEQEKTQRIQAANTIDDLKTAILHLKIIETSNGSVAALEVIRRIDQVRNGHRSLDFVTRTYGIRARLQGLLADDRVYKKMGTS